MWLTCASQSSEGYLGGVVQNERLNARVVELVKQLDGRILILVNRIAHGETLAAMLGGPEGNVYWVSGSDTLEERAMVLQQLRASNAGRCVAILSSIGNTGIDVHLHHLVRRPRDCVCLRARALARRASDVRVADQCGRRT